MVPLRGNHGTRASEDMAALRLAMAPSIGIHRWHPLFTQNDTLPPTDAHQPRDQVDETVSLDIS